MSLIKFLLIFCSMIIVVELKDEYQLILKRLQCHNDNTVCKNLYCNLHAIKKNTASINAGCEIVNPLKAIRVTGVVYHRIKEYRKYLIDVDLDYCKLVAGEKSTPAVMIIYSLLKAETTNLIHKCPYEGNVTLSNFVVKTGYFPPFIPYGDYRLDLNFYIPTNNKSALELNIYATIQKDIRDII